MKISKKALVLWLSILLLLCAVPVSADVYIYAEDGRSVPVKESEVEAYKAVGWYESKIVPMYSADGRETNVNIENIEEYKSVGWYIEPLTTLYAPDGRTVTVLQSEVLSYQEVGWYTEPVDIMYSADGREIVVLKNEVSQYRQVGWYTEPVSYMYSADGREIVVLKDEVSKYSQVGWYAVPVVTVTSLDGRSIVILESEIDLYESVGWYYGIPTTIYYQNGTISKIVGSEHIWHYISLGWVTDLYSEKPVYKFHYKISNDTITVISKYGQKEDIITTLKKKGGNNLFDFYEFATMNNLSSEPLPKPIKSAVFSTTQSDWHSPFVVRAKYNADGDEPDSFHFTGGNHEYTSTGHTGTPTARTAYLSFKVDGTTKSNSSGYGNFLEISWTNFVQGSNTKKANGYGREILKENHVLTFDGKVWESYVELIPLEDVTINIWYGLQCCATSDIYRNQRFLENFSYTKLIDGAVGSDGVYNKANKFVGYGNRHKVEMGIDSSFGLGKREFYKGNQYLFSTSYGKAYFWVIQNTDLSAYNVYAMKGYYKFMPV